MKLTQDLASFPSHVVTETDSICRLLTPLFDADVCLVRLSLTSSLIERESACRHHLLPWCVFRALSGSNFTPHPSHVYLELSSRLVSNPNLFILCAVPFCSLIQTSAFVGLRLNIGKTEVIHTYIHTSLVSA